MQVYICADEPDPSRTFDFESAIQTGIVKAAMQEAFGNSSEKSVKVSRRPTQKVVVVEDKKDGDLELVYLSKSLALIVDDGSKKVAAHVSGDAVFIRDLFRDEKGKPVHCVVRTDLRFPKKGADGSAREAVESNIVAAWACRDTVYKDSSDAIRSTKEVKVSVGKKTVVIHVPIIKSTRALKAGEEVIFLKPGVDPSARDDEPPSKRAKTGAPKGTKGAKGKGKCRK